MKKLRKLLFILTVLVMCLSISMPVSAAVKISSKSVTLTVGKKKQLKVTGTKKKVKWSSNKKKVATVSQKGMVTAKSAGTAKITAKVGSKKYTCTVKVKNNDSKEKSLFKNKKECGDGTFYIYFASGTSQGGNIPEVYVDKNFPFGYVDYCVYDVDNSVPIRVYIDGEQVDITYVGFKLQKSMSFSGSRMEEGIHVVEMVQFEENDTSEKVLTYRKAKYKVLYK